jgi:salicylate hydroxylase
MPTKEPDMPAPRSALISGAGIAGLAAALALHQRGIRVTVLEQATELRELGAGVQVAPNGARVLQALGLSAAAAAVACLAAAKEVRLWNSGQRWPLFDLGDDARGRFGAPYWMFHRSDLHRVLLDGLNAAAPGSIVIGARVLGCTQGENGIRAHCADARQLDADLLIAADGVHSSLRATVLGQSAAASAASFTGLMAWRGVVPIERLPASQAAPLGVNWVGPGGHVITYPVRRGELLNVVAIVERHDWLGESWSDAGRPEDMRRDLAGWHPDIQRLIDAIATPYRWALLSRAPLPQWVQGRLVLIGDAAHPMLPFLAQGANMALEDALLLARCLTEPAGLAALGSAQAGVPAALARFFALRHERTSRVVRGSAENARRFHNPVLGESGTAAAAYIDREWQPDKVRLRYDWLFEYDAIHLPLDLTTA